MDRRNVFAAIVALPFAAMAALTGSAVRKTKRAAKRLFLRDESNCPGVWVSGRLPVHGRRRHAAIYYSDAGEYSTPVIQLMDETAKAANLAFGLDPAGRPYMQVTDRGRSVLVDLMKVAEFFKSQEGEFVVGNVITGERPKEEV